MELLINELMQARRRALRLEAKVFGGGAVIAGMTSDQRRRAQHRSSCSTTCAPSASRCVSKDVLDVHPRKVCVLPASGKAMVKRLPPANADALVAQERDAAAQQARRPRRRRLDRPVLSAKELA